MTRKGILAILVLFAMTEVASSQAIAGLASRCSDSFREWIVYTEDPNIRGELRMRWTMQDDWTFWDMYYGDVNATIEQKLDEDPGFWIIRANGKTVNAKATWRGDYTRWKLSDGDHQINWRAKFANQRDEWEIDTRDPKFFMHTQWREDPREWRIVDNLPEDVSEAMKIAMIFLALHFSTPRI